MLPWACMLVAGAVATSHASDLPFTKRYGIFIGANTGSAVEPLLRYAESDAGNLAALLNDVGDIPTTNTLVMRGPTASTVRERFASMSERIADERAHGNDVLLFVYYSGHADALAMHLGGTLLPWNDLLHLTNGTLATTKLVVVDACRSGELTRVKGAKRAAPFLLPAQEGEALPQGVAILASSTANESSQESDSLHGSLFTHHLIEALRGAADRNADGHVSLNEAFQYASDSTAFTSAQTEEGLQHATFSYRLRGRSDLVLTRPVLNRDMAFLNIREPGEYRFSVADCTGPTAMDAVVPEGGRSITLPAGSYCLQARTPAALREGTVTLFAAHTTNLDSSALTRVNLMAVALKGGQANDAAVAEADGIKRWAVHVGGGAQMPFISGFSVPWSVAVLGTRRFDTFMLDLQLDGGQSSGQNNALKSTMTDVGVAAGVRGFIDLDPWVLSLGTRAGVLWLGQSYSGANAPENRSQVAPQLQAVARVDVNLTSNFSLGLELGARGLLLTRVVTTTGLASTWVQVNPFATFNLGYHW